MKINIKRKKHLAGSLLPYYCIFGMDREAFVEIGKRFFAENEHAEIMTFLNRLLDACSIKRIMPIRYGETISLEISNDERRFFVFTNSDPEFSVSNQIDILSDNDKYFEIKTMSDAWKGMSLYVERKKLLGNSKKERKFP